MRVLCSGLRFLCVGVVLASACGSGDQLRAASPAACEQSLISSWQQSLPSVGFASAASAAAYDAEIAALLDRPWMGHPLSTYPGGRWPAVSVAVVQQGRLVFAKSYGFANISQPQLAHPDDLFRLASDSKQITGAVILKLIADGQSVDGDPAHRLTLQSKVFQILASPPGALAPLAGPGTLHADLDDITVEDLLHHAGGWNGGVGDPVDYAGKPGAVLPPTDKDVVRYMMNQPVQHRPHGSTYCYSNFGYNVLATLVEKITGRSYESVAKDLVLRPLGITRMKIGDSLKSGAGEVTYYAAEGGGNLRSLFPEMTGPTVSGEDAPYGSWSLYAGRGAGGWIGSAMDMVRFQIGVDGTGPVQLFSSPQAMVSSANISPNACYPNYNPATQWYNAGWIVVKNGVWGHDGGATGAGSNTTKLPNGDGYAAVINMSAAPPKGEVFDWDGALSRAYHRTLANGGSFLKTDLFDQFGEWTAWRGKAGISSNAAHDLGAGCAYKGKNYSACYPSRIEGRQTRAGASYRAEFVPLHAGGEVKYSLGAACNDFAAMDKKYLSGGYHRVNLQWFEDPAGRMRFQSVWVKAADRR